jgi:hypothetical protein
VTWALNTWKQVEDIRKVRAETRKLPAFSEKEVEEIASLKHITPQLVFPEAAENPVLQLSHAEQK